MGMRVISAIFLALLVGVGGSPAVACELVGIVGLPAVACELEQAQWAWHRTDTAFLTEHDGAVRSTPRRQLVDCKADGAPCSADTDCCSGSCKPAAEGRACVPK